MTMTTTTNYNNNNNNNNNDNNNSSNNNKTSNYNNNNNNNNSSNKNNYSSNNNNNNNNNNNSSNNNNFAQSTPFSNFISLSDLLYFIYRFTIDASSGEIKTAVALDRETADQHDIRVLSKDKGPSSREAEVHVLINVSDINDHRPAFSQRHYFVEVNEQQPAHVILNLTVRLFNICFGS